MYKQVEVLFQNKATKVTAIKWIDQKERRGKKLLRTVPVTFVSKNQKDKLNVLFHQKAQS